MRFLFSAVILLVLSSSGAAAQTGAKRSARLPEQNRCFCIYEVEDSTAPARIVRFTPSQPGCKKVKYTPGPEGTTPEENGLLNCYDLRECFKEERVLAVKAKTLRNKGLGAQDIVGKCCTDGSCDENCLARWGKAGGGVAQDAMDIVSSEGRKKPCIPVMKKPTLKESLDMNIDGLMSQ